MPHFIFTQQISVLNILNMLYNLHFFLSLKCRLFHNATLFGFCITHILNTGCAKIWKNSVAKRLTLKLQHSFVNTLYIGLHVKCPLFLRYFITASIFSTYFRNMLKSSNVTKIHPVVAELFQSDEEMAGQTYRHDEGNMRFSQLCEHA